ncbi:DNA starvation/stationary phase protection protein [Lutibacter sp. TH_r2]|uniref:Dps family protein n=1 Tax=Lutibacter sp. TH_r2 TaxID=3082083 RepID=UPI002955A573|nr:DNA starvation/stationary phase protection protein [Lutibacter sp. TH_r2]MDV7186079.1 DNA starvation/stationary phase protection protein [Lutibacter sp. TH_r2]
MNKIGFNMDYSEEVVGKLNAYLSSLQIAYMNVRGYHWNIEGKQFFTLHSKFEEVYNSLNEMADEVAERILILGGKPLHSFSEYLKISEINEQTNVSSSEESINSLLNDTQKLLNIEREILSFASENGDEGTVGLLSEYIGEQEKMTWMLNAQLK